MAMEQVVLRPCCALPGQSKPHSVFNTCIAGAVRAGVRREPVEVRLEHASCGSSGRLNFEKSGIFFSSHIFHFPQKKIAVSRPDFFPTRRRIVLDEYASFLPDIRAHVVLLCVLGADNIFWTPLMEADCAYRDRRSLSDFDRSKSISPLLHTCSEHACHRAGVLERSRNVRRYESSS